MQWARDPYKRRQILRIGLCVHMVLWGCIYVFGPLRIKSSPSLLWIDQLFWGFVPIEAWGGVAIILGLLLLTAWRFAAHCIAHVFWAAWSLCALAATFTVEGAAGGGWLHTTWVAITHLQFALYEDDDYSTLDFSYWRKT